MNDIAVGKWCSFCYISNNCKTICQLLQNSFLFLNFIHLSQFQLFACFFLPKVCQMNISQISEMCHSPTVNGIYLVVVLIQFCLHDKVILELMQMNLMHEREWVFYISLLHVMRGRLLKEYLLIFILQYYAFLDCPSLCNVFFLMYCLPICHMNVNQTCHWPVVNGICIIVVLL